MIDSEPNSIHRISALAGDAHRSADFYVKALRLRLVKRTVNQKDPLTYHLFYGNSKGSPGSTLTLFSWPMVIQGKPGPGEAVRVALAVASHSMGNCAEEFGIVGNVFDG